MSLSIQVFEGVHIASLSGPLDQGAGSAMVTTIKASVERGSPLILDFTMLSGIDTDGLKQLLALKRWADQGSSRLWLAGASPQVWQFVKDKNCDSNFETAPSLAAAKHQAGLQGDDSAAQPAGSADYSDFETSFTPPMQEDEYSTRAAQPPPLPEDDPWSMPADNTPPQHQDWPNSAGGDAWNRIQSEDQEGDEPIKPSRRGFLVTFAAGALAIICIGLYFLADYLREPEIQLSDHLVETQEGQELPEMRIVVKNGTLEYDQLPQGLYLGDSMESSDGLEYYLGGTPKESGSYEVELIAKRGQKIKKNFLRIEVKERSLEWQVPRKMDLKQGKALTTSQVSKLVVGARILELNWDGDPLEGLEVVEMPGSKGTWQLAGTAEKSGTFQAVLVAKRKSGEAEKREFTVMVMPEEVAPDPGNPTPAQDIANTPVEVPTPDSANEPRPPPHAADERHEASDVMAGQADEKMRGFLLERIEKANSHFSALDKETLRVIIGRLTEARLLTTITFGNNVSTVDNRQRSALKEALRDPAVVRLLEHSDCHIVVVGYASKVGPPAYNVKISKTRAKAVDDILQETIHRRADLCGDYGPTDVVSHSEAGNRVVEVFIGLIELSRLEQQIADRFKEDFNKRHGVRR